MAFTPIAEGDSATPAFMNARFAEVQGPEAVNVKEATYGAAGDGSTDDTSAFTNALATGKDVFVPPGEYVISSTITLSATGQKLVGASETTLAPNFDGDLIHVTGRQCGVHINIDGSNQPSTGNEGNAITIGQGGAAADFCDLTGTRVLSFYGSGFVWDQGPNANFESTLAQSCSSHGYWLTAVYNDNNHGFFANCQSVSNTSLGIYVQKVDNGSSTVSNGDARNQYFANMKGFGNQRNFVIETNGNVGAVFSELGNQPDLFTSSSQGNRITYIGDETAFGGVSDSGANNVLDGYSSYKQFDYKGLFAQVLDIQKLLEGRLRFTQTAAREFESTITGTSSFVTVSHKAGSASGRVDVFEDRTLFGDAFAVWNPIAFQSEVSLGLRRSAASTLKQSYGTFSVERAHIDTGSLSIASQLVAPSNVSGQGYLYADSASSLYWVNGSGVSTLLA